MVVVGILGVLIMLAGPQYERYQARAKQSEAKINLAAIYGNQRSFYAEYGAFIAGLDAIGWSPEGDKRFYGLGWASCSSAGDVSGYSSSGGTCYYARANVPSAYTTGSCNFAQTDLSGTVPASGTLDSQSFTVAAQGQIRPSSGCDVWRVDQTKGFANSTAGF